MYAMKILNLYAGIGGNRKLWGDKHEVVAVENVPEIAKVYQNFFPGDKVVVDDAHKYLLEHHQEFDFIWSSPPCPTHSVTNNFLYSQGHVRYPDMSLYQEIILLKHRFKGKWCVENVKGYYQPLIMPKVEIDRHLYWSNFYIPPLKVQRGFNIANARASTRQDKEDYDKNLEEYHGIKLPKGTKNQRLLLRNAVWPEMGLHIFKSAFNETKQGILL